MPQSISFSAVTSATFDGQVVDEIVINGVSAWISFIQPSIQSDGAFSTGGVNAVWVLVPPLWIDAANGKIYVRNASLSDFANMPLTFTVTSSTTSRGGYTTSSTPLIDLNLNTANLNNTGTVSWRAEGEDSYNNGFTSNTSVHTSNNELVYTYSGTSAVAGSTGTYQYDVVWGGPDNRTWVEVQQNSNGGGSWNRPPAFNSGALPVIG
jgi:hypothetical protein